MTRLIQMNRRLLLGGMTAGIGLAFAGQAGAQTAGGRRKLVVIIARGRWTACP